MLKDVLLPGSNASDLSERLRDVDADVVISSAVTLRRFR
jgi:hypothetical protein